MAVIALVSILFAISCDPRQTPIIKPAIEEFDRQSTSRTDEAIRRDPELRHLDEFCSEVPKPTDSKLTKKGGLDDKTVRLSYYYSSNVPFLEAQSLWRDYFDKNGWLMEKEEDSYPKRMAFRGQDYRVTMYYGGLGSGAQFSISCEKMPS